ncbi:MAG: hypothetical protein RLZZ344_11 [Pseudomonadota bacterium]|jgi:hypothetical protein
MASKRLSPVPRLGLLFDYDWDAVAHQRFAGEIAFDRAGFDLFRWSGRLHLLRLNLFSFADRLAARGRSRRWRGVVSHHELYGTLLAAMVAERLGLPGPGVGAVLACHHKGYTRGILQSLCPEVNPRWELVQPPNMPGRGSRTPPEMLVPPYPERFPVYLKPVRATFSALARSIHDPTAWQAYFSALLEDRWVTNRLLAPFAHVLHHVLPEAGSSFQFLSEEPVWSPQYNLDGYVDGAGDVQLLGVVDAVSYPGTQAFQRWEYPSRLPVSVIQSALLVARKFLRAIGFGQGFFNLEFFYDAAASRITVIEFNPRLSSQFSALYRMVLGCDPHAMAMALAQGEDPRRVPLVKPTARVAASLVWRAFDPREIPTAPSRVARRRLEQAFPGQTLFEFSRTPAALSRAFRWMESYRYGVVNVGAVDSEGLRRQSEQISEILGWPNGPYAQHLSELSRGSGHWTARAH